MIPSPYPFVPPSLAADPILAAAAPGFHLGPRSPTNSTPDGWVMIPEGGGSQPLEQNHAPME